uniref:Reverse transcriptase domain-containing protein n=1 Tax=Cajanus cajan TaxID=3821 RepID=A0A151SEM9_CAJCA|nr:hypothetical protein KK1_024856 [Cajanus cajan]
MVNGQPLGFFPCSRGVRQGDPLSPLLFYITEEVFSRALSVLSTSGKLARFEGSSGSFPNTCSLC